MAQDKSHLIWIDLEMTGLVPATDRILEVAVVVTTGPGPDLEATLASLVAQDYAELSLLVLANGDHPDVSGRVAAVADIAAGAGGVVGRLWFVAFVGVGIH